MKSHRLLRADAARIWSAALRAVEPEAAVRVHVKRQGKRLRICKHPIRLKEDARIWVIGAGKAAAPMGLSLESILGRRLAGGLLVTRYGHGLPLKKLELIEAGHPLPDSRQQGRDVRTPLIGN